MGKLIFLHPPSGEIMDLAPDPTTTDADYLHQAIMETARDIGGDDNFMYRIESLAEGRGPFPGLKALNLLEKKCEGIGGMYVAERAQELKQNNMPPIQDTAERLALRREKASHFSCSFVRGLARTMGFID